MSDSDAGRWPDFVGIGAIKCGTTWLHSCLTEHPQIVLPTTKELEFFDERYSLGPRWYKSFFTCSPDLVCGEISPQYMHNPRALTRIQESLNNPRLIVCLRNPVERAYSHFMMDMRDTDVDAEEKVKRFDAVVRAKDNKYVQFGFFHRQLLPYYESFKAERIHVVLFDDIKSSPLDVLRGVFTFLGVDPSFEPANMWSRVNAAKRYRSVFVFKTLQSAVRLSERAGLGGLVLRAKTGGLRDRVLRLLEVSAPNPPMSDFARSSLVDLYVDDVKKLSGLLNKDMTRWIAR